VISPRRLPFVLLACVCVLAAWAPSAGAAETMRIDDPITDNYKASYNDDPSQPELRTWFALRTITAGATTWKPAEPDSISVVAPSVAVEGADGRSGELTASTSSGPLEAPELRIDPTSADSGGRWGVLVALSDRDALRGARGVVSLTLRVDGATLAVGTVDYRYDASITSADPGDIEDNGPGGRWFVGGVATRMDWNADPSPLPSLVAGASTTSPSDVRPRITSFVVPVRTCSRMITIRERGRAGTSRNTRLRVSVAGRAYGRWVRIAPRYRIVLPRGVGVRAVRVQLRDARGLTSRIVTGMVRRACP
jgi:hypothetical protein